LQLAPRVRAPVAVAVALMLFGLACTRSNPQASGAPPGGGSGGSPGTGGVAPPPDDLALPVAAPPDAAPPQPPIASCTGKSAQPADGSWTRTVGATTRTVEAHVPPSYDPTKPTPLVLNFHGYTSNGAQQAGLTGFDAKADANGFVVLYPEGTGSPTGFNGGACCGAAARDQVDDIGFTRAIIAAARARLCVDDQRIFVTGFSNGGFMSHRIACELADVVAAVAPVSGVLGLPSCAPARPIAVLDFHGTSDRTVPYGGSSQDGWPSALDTFHGWAQRDQCSDGTPAQTYQKGDVACATYSRCAGGAEVTLCTITGGGHAWPGSLFPLPGTTQNINATDAIWTFFAAHPMP
jgi:polyhydroxybutyrate depolymerase